MKSIIQQTSYKVLSITFGSCAVVSGLILIFYKNTLRQKTRKLEQFQTIKLYQVQDLANVQLQNQYIAVVGEVDFEQYLWSIDSKQKIIYGKSHTYEQNKIFNSEIRDINKNDNSSVERMIQNEFYLRDLYTHQIHLKVFGIMDTHIEMGACNYLAKIFKIPDFQVVPKEGEWIIENCITQNCPIILFGNVRFTNGVHRMTNPQYICQFQQDIQIYLQKEREELQAKQDACQFFFIVSTSLLVIICYKSIIS